MHTESIFQDGISYENVYFMMIDASGHSNIVINNPADKVNKLFDLLESNVYSAVEENRNIRNCKYAEFWGWQGDGGLCIIYDESETSALSTALDSAYTILDHKLPQLRDTLSKLKINGELNIRIAVHKGSYTYKGDDKRGSIHSKDLNFVCHLESKTPVNSVTISEKIYKLCDVENKEKFQKLDFQFEGNVVYVHNKKLSNSTHYEWLSKIDFHNSFKMNSFHERPSEIEKATFMSHATTEVIDLGTAASTCAFYLGSTMRPAAYRDTVFSLLEKGVSYTCIILHPDSEITEFYSKVRGENLKKKCRSSLELFAKFSEKSARLKGDFKVFTYSQLPYFACIAVDRHQNGSFIFSPYMPYGEHIKIERADTIHFLFNSSQNTKVFEQLNNSINNILADPNTKEYKF